METIQSDIRNRSAIDEKFEIIAEYDDPDAYEPENSYHGDGKYPEDWHKRRNAIWWLQEHLCGRCGRNLVDILLRLKTQEPRAVGVSGLQSNHQTTTSFGRG